MDSSLNACLDVLRQWNRCHGPYFQIAEKHLLWNLREQDLVTYSSSMVGGVSTIYAVASPRGVSAGLAGGSLWFSLWGKIPAAREDDFARGLVELAAQLGKTRITMAGDEFHFLPGVPEGDSRLIEALKSAGFEGVVAADFCGDVRTDAVTEYIKGAHEIAAKMKWRFTPVSTARELGELEEFLSQEFAGRWLREFRFWKSREDTRRGFWNVLRDDSGVVLGFARMAVRGRIENLDQGWNPGALRLPLRDGVADEPRDSCLGPIGVATSQRGQGAGRVLLGFTLETLKSHNAGPICIDWTDAFKYYYPLQFEVVRKYWTAWRK